MTQLLEITLPNKWEEVTLGQYIRYNKVNNPKAEDVVEAFCNLTKKDLRTLGMKNVQEIFESVSKVLEEPTDKFPLTYKVEVKGKKYGLIPNFDKMSYGEYLDLSEYMKDTQNNLDKIMSVLYRPITKEDKQGRYLIKPYTGEEDYKEMLSMPMDVVFSVLAFFFAIAKILLNHIPTYMTKMAKEPGQTSEELSMQDGEHINRYMSLLQETLDGLTKSQNFLFTNA